MNEREARTLLGVTVDSSPADIQRAYRKLAGQHHPDGGGTVEKFHALQEAYKLSLADAEGAACLRCGGEGRTKIQHGFAMSSYVCEDCGGSGKRWPLFLGKK